MPITNDLTLFTCKRIVLAFNVTFVKHSFCSWKYMNIWSSHYGIVDALEKSILPHSVSFLTDSFKQKTSTSWQCVRESKTSLVKLIMCLAIKCVTLCPFFLLSFFAYFYFSHSIFFFPFFKALPIQKYKEACVESEKTAFVSHLSNTSWSKSFRSKFKTQTCILNPEQKRMANLCCSTLWYVVVKQILIHLVMTNVCRIY